MSFLGSIVRVRAHVAGHALSFDLFNTTGLVPPRLGEPIELHFAPEACLVLPQSIMEARRAISIGRRHDPKAAATPLSRSFTRP